MHFCGEFLWPKAMRGKECKNILEWQTPSHMLQGNGKHDVRSENEFSSWIRPLLNILSYLVAVFDLNLIFSNFPIATGKKWCGGLCMFGFNFFHWSWLVESFGHSKLHQFLLPTGGFLLWWLLCELVGGSTVHLGSHQAVADNSTTYNNLLLIGKSRKILDLYLACLLLDKYK